MTNGEPLNSEMIRNALRAASNRVLIVMTLVIWYATVRMAIYRYFIPKVLDPGGTVDAFDWWWSWFIAIPATMITLMISALLVGFVLYGG